MDRNTIFISDLHLSPIWPKTITLFKKFIDGITPQTEALYILGDLFQLWAGDDDYSEFNNQIKNLIKKVSDKTPVFLMPGNRDFLLGNRFVLETNCILLTDPCPISLYTKIAVVTHGDILCTKDLKYRIFRLIIRFPLGLKIFLLLPLKFRLWLAKKIQSLSIKIKNYGDKNSAKVQLNTVRKILKKYGSTLMIHGHMHKIEVEDFLINGKEAKRICLDEWKDKTKILIYHDDHRIEFKELVADEA